MWLFQGFALAGSCWWVLLRGSNGTPLKHPDPAGRTLELDEVGGADLNDAGLSFPAAGRLLADSDIIGSSAGDAEPFAETSALEAAANDLVDAPSSAAHHRSEVDADSIHSINSIFFQLNSTKSSAHVHKENISSMEHTDLAPMHADNGVAPTQDITSVSQKEEAQPQEAKPRPSLMRREQPGSDKSGTASQSDDNYLRRLKQRWEAGGFTALVGDSALEQGIASPGTRLVTSGASVDNARVHLGADAVDVHRKLRWQRYILGGALLIMLVIFTYTALRPRLKTILSVSKTPPSDGEAVLAQSRTNCDAFWSHWLATKARDHVDIDGDRQRCFSGSTDNSGAASPLPDSMNRYGCNDFQAHRAADRMIPLAALREQIAAMELTSKEAIDKLLPQDGGYDCVFAKPLSSRQLLRLRARIECVGAGVQLIAPLSQKPCVLYSALVSQRVHGNAVTSAFAEESVDFSVSLADEPHVRISISGEDALLFDTEDGRSSQVWVAEEAPEHFKDFATSHEVRVAGSGRPAMRALPNGTMLEFQECSLLVGAVVTIVGELFRQPNGALSMQPLRGVGADSTPRETWRTSWECAGLSRLTPTVMGLDAGSTRRHSQGGDAGAAVRVDKVLISDSSSLLKMNSTRSALAGVLPACVSSRNVR